MLGWFFEAAAPATTECVALMRCPECYTDNPESQRSCADCGAQLLPKCSRCGADASLDARFCSQCGKPLEAAGNLSATDFDGADVERRHLTVLFCDLVGSTAIAEKLDPEDWRSVIRDYHAACGEQVRRLEGHVAQYLGDGLLIYFGYPVAFEDSARRALQAGLAILQAVSKQNQRLSEATGAELRVRVGVHSGLVVLDSIGERQELLALGDTPNIAARVQAVADPNTLVITEATRRLTSGFFNLSSLGQSVFKGASEQIALYRVESESGAGSRLEAASAAGLSRLVGRQREQERLLGLWAGALEGKGPTVLLTGEPGIGKSRQIAELRQRVAVPALQVIECRCSPYQQSSPLHPFVDMFERRLGRVRDNQPAEIAAILQAEVAGVPGQPALQAGLLAGLLSLPVDPGFLSPELLPQQRRQATFDLLLAWLDTLAARHPTLLIVEDLHWADPSTLELLGLLIKRPPRGQLLTVLNARPEFEGAWADDERFQVINLPRLERGEMEQIVSDVAGNRPLPRTLVDQVIASADGVPLFLEEITRSVLESGLVRDSGNGYELAGTLTHDAIPATIQDSCMARLDRLGAGKRLIQLAAVLGREFSSELLGAVTTMPAEVLSRGLQQLVDSQLLLEDRRSSSPAFQFKHALIQDAAYHSLSRATRLRYHLQVAATLKTHFPEIGGRRPELLAHHYEAAGMVDEAIQYWHTAGQQALGESAHAEAIGHMRRGLQMASGLTDAAERARQELNLRAGLGVALITTRGFAAPEVEETFTRAAELCALLGEPPLRVLYGIWVGNVVRSDPGPTALLVPRLQELAQHARDDDSRVVCLASLGTWAFWQGRYDLVLDYHGRAVGLCDINDPKRQHESLLRDFGFEGLLYPHLYLAWRHLLVGLPAEALRLHDQAFALAERIGDPYLLAGASQFAATLNHDLGDHDRSRHFADRCRALSTERGFPFWLAASSVMSGAAQVKQGHAADGFPLIEQGLSQLRLIGAKMPYPYLLSCYADALLLVGDPARAMATIDEALAMARANVDRNYEPELLRLRGEALASQGDLPGAEQHFRMALALCSAQGARTLEQRADASLGRILHAREPGQRAATGRS